MTSDETYVKVRRGLLAHLATMSDGALKCYLYLLLIADHRTGEVVATAASIGAAIGKSQFSAYRYLTELVAADYISVDGRGELDIVVKRYETVDTARKNGVRRRVEKAIRETEERYANMDDGTVPGESKFQEWYQRLAKKQSVETVDKSTE